MKLGIIFSLLFSLQIYAQNGTCMESSIHSRSLDGALLNKDGARLVALLHDKLSYGHSNGWTESKFDLLDVVLPNPKVQYHKITTYGNLDVEDIREDLRIIRKEQRIVGLLDNAPLDIYLKSMEVWICEDERWQLVARQSTKMPPKD